MAITSKTPYIKQSVGAQYIAFATGVNPLVFETNIEKTETVKSIKTTENADSTVVRASGKDYKTISKASSVEVAIEVIAFVAETLAKMRGETVDVGGLVLSGAQTDRPYFAYGKVVLLDGGKARYEWFPKCQLVSNTDDISTSEESFSEQNDTLTIKAYAFDAAGNIKTYVQSDMTNFPAGLTEAEFFAAPILNAAGLTAANGV
ncbi:MAG TPA: phage tail protein [Erysipelotrichaceae bacterium]|nr:phage tail protein [Erysipelotrichaceae bacterium]